MHSTKASPNTGMADTRVPQNGAANSNNGEHSTRLHCKSHKSGVLVGNIKRGT